MIKLYYDEMDSPIGPLVMLSDGSKLIRIDFGPKEEWRKKLTKWTMLYANHSEIVKHPQLFQKVRYELEGYFKGKQHIFTTEYELFGTEFQRNVWKALGEIPFGETTSYQDIAVAIGNPKAVRAVGGAVNKNPLSILVPCHRVIGKNGKLVGYNGGIDNKEFLLQLESSISLA